ncbi:MAG TPA: thiolase family protein [Dehalococcoidia bacterium]|nr:thiolase family protein [Dehalococcoidia bacterium]
MLDINGKYCIVGVGNTEYGRTPGRNAVTLTVEAIRNAIEDCGIDKGEIDAVLTKYPTSNFQGLFSARVAQALGVVPRVTATLDQAGASNISLIAYAIMCMEAGLCNVATISYGDNPNTSGRPSYGRRPAAEAARGPTYGGDEAVAGMTGAPCGYAMIAQRYRYEYGLTDEQLGTIATTFRRHASLNPNAQFQQPFTMEEYLSSRWVAEPFRLYDCCPVSDGAAAVIVTSVERARGLKKKPVSVMSFAQAHPAWDLAQREVLTTSGAAISGPTAFRLAGISVEDVDFAELYDCFTIVPIVTLEDYGFCKKGEGPDFIGGGRIGLEGSLPLNTSGGLLSETGMPGMQLIVEAVRQLRGEAGPRQVKDPEICVVSNQGGVMTTHATLVLRN